MPTAAFDEKTGTATLARFRSADAAACGYGTKEADGILPSPPTSTASSGAADSSQKGSTGQTQERINDVDPVIRLSPGQLPDRRFKVLQQWEGVVHKVEGDSLMADLLDLTDRSRPREIVEIPLVEIPDADQSLILPGCVFYWIMGYETSLGGQKRRVSEIRVRRNPEWSQRAIESITARGNELYQRLEDQSEDNPTQT